MGHAAVSRARRALVVVDVQNEYFGGRLSIEHPPRDESVARILEAISAARRHGVPVIVVRQVAPPDAPAFAVESHGAALHPDLEGVESYARVEKTLPSAFARTELDAHLARLGVDTVTLVGYMIQNCIVASAFDGLQRGYQIEVLADATGTLGLANPRGAVAARDVQRVFEVVLQSRAAAVMDVGEWSDRLQDGQSPRRDTLVGSAAAWLEARG
jgi:nicotinamidase-related amidase